MKATFDSIDIQVVASAVPKRKEDLLSLGANWGTDLKRVIGSTGISCVRVSEPNQTTSDLAAAAAEVAFKRAAIDRESIDGIVFVSQTPDYVMPATSAVIQDRLGLRKDVVAFDINYGCSGYVYGLAQASMLISSGFCERVLLCVGDTTTKLINSGDRSVRMVFGDAASASVVTRGKSKIAFSLKTDGSGARSLIIPAGGMRTPSDQESKLEKTDSEGNVRSSEDLFMDGLAIMNYAVREVPAIIDDILEYVGLGKEALDFVGLHQANEFMIRYLAKKCGLRADLVPFGAAEFGNTGPASIPLLMSWMQSAGLWKNPRRALLCGFGVGFSTAASVLSLEDTLILKPIELE